MELYINNKYIEYGDTISIPITYQLDDIQNPGAIKTDVSKSVSIPSTKINDDALNHLYRVDRTNITSFNVSSKIPFEIRTETNDIFKSGYVKFDNISIDMNGNKVYNVTLFSKEAEFFKLLSDTKLVDLVNDLNISHNITASFIYNNWSSGSGASGIHGKIRYIPMMNGLHKEFNNKKLIKTNNTILELTNNLDEWSVKDFRSYKQRPGIVVKKIWEQLKTNLTGYTFDDTSWCNTDNPYYNDIVVGFNIMGQSKSAFDNKVSIIKQGRDASITISDGFNENYNLLDKYYASTQDELTFDNGGSNPYLPITIEEGEVGLKGTLKYSVKWNPHFVTVENLPASVDNIPVWIQLNEYNTPDFGIKFETNQFFNNSTEFSHAYSGYVYCPAGVGDRNNCYIVDTEGSTTRQVWSQTNIYEDTNAAIKMYGNAFVSRWKFDIYNDGNIRTVWDGDGNEIAFVTNPWYQATFESTEGNYVQTEFDLSKKDIHSHTLITADDFIDSAITAQQFILEYFKHFGLYLTVNNDNVVTIKKRSDFYQNETLDWENILDYSKDIVIQPLVFDKRRLVFGYKENTSNNYFKEYKEKVGYSYGDRVVNTGYDFTDDKLRVFDKTVFNPIQMVTNQIYVYDVAGNTLTGEYLTLPSSFNISKNGSEREQVDNSMFFLFEDGFTNYLNYDVLTLSDDTADMFATNEFYYNLYNPAYTVTQFPKFTTIYTNLFGSYSLDYGKPTMIWTNDTDDTYPESITLYNKYWMKYISDRYNIDTKIMIAYFSLTNVDMNYFKPNKFIYVNGVNWVINKVSDYNPNNDNSTLVELISVQDKNNYLTL